MSTIGLVLAAGAGRRYGMPKALVPGWLERLWHPRFHQGHFEELYGQAHDPHCFDSNPFERQKYEDILAQLGERHYGRALEVGCSIGTFTEMVAPRCDELVAVDISLRAVERARTRLEGLDGVVVERRTLPLDMPPGTFDLIVCSDVMGYWHREVLLAGTSRLVEALRPGGQLVCLHWRGDYGVIPGEQVHQLLAEHITLPHTVALLREDVGPLGAGYRLDCWERPALR